MSNAPVKEANIIFPLKGQLEVFKKGDVRAGVESILFEEPFLKYSYVVGFRLSSSECVILALADSEDAAHAAMARFDCLCEQYPNEDKDIV